MRALRLRAPVLMTLLLSLALPPLLPAQVSYGGYLAVGYTKTQSEGDNPKGYLDSILGGLFARGVFNGRFGFLVEATFADESGVGIKQAWAGFVPSEKFNVKAGLYLVPFGVWNRADRPHEQPLITTPLNLSYIYPASWRDIGVVVEGRISVISYAFYIGNGLKDAELLNGGQQFRDNNTDKAKGGRLGLILSESISAGASYYEGKYDDEGLFSHKLEGVDLSVVTSQWELHGEYTKGFIENPEPFERGETEGYSVWAVMSYRSFHPVASYQKMKYNDPFRGGGLALDISRWSLGVRFVLSSSFFLKVEYDWNREEPKLKNNALRLQAALGF